VDLPDARANQETRMAEDQLQTRLLEAISSLPVPHRQVITLALEGLGYAEIAAVLGIGESNVGARLTRARQTLRRLLEVQNEKP